MPQTMQAPCPRCGNAFTVDLTKQRGSAACPACGENVRIVSHSSAMLTAVKPEDAVDLAPAIASGAWKGVVKQPPAAAQLKPAPAVDYEDALEREMLAQARAAATAREAQCHDWDGRKAFSAQLNQQHPKTLVMEPLNVTVAAMDGLLFLETIVAPLPRPPLSTLRDVINRMQALAGGSVFLLRSCGIVVRHRLVPRMNIETGINGDCFLRALRQLNYDRIVAAPFLQEEWLCTGLSKPVAIEKAFNMPLAASVASSISLQQLKHLAEHSGYSTLAKGDRLYLNQERASAESPVWLTINGGVLRGWAHPGSLHETTQSAERWGVLSKLMGRGKTEAQAASRGQVDKLLDRLNEMNESAGLLNYLWDGEHVVSMAIWPPTEKRIEIEEFQAFVETLFKRARDVAEKALHLQQAG